MGRCAVTPKVFLVLLGFVFWCAAAGLLFVGAWVYKEYENYDQLAKATYTLIPATIIMATGVFFFLLGIIGCAGALKEQRCLLGMFFSILLVLLAGMLVAAVLGYVYRRDVDSAVHDGIEDAMNDYGNDTVLTEQINFMQRELKCCGMSNYTDWANTTWGVDWASEHAHDTNVTDPNNPYPTSCCVNELCDYKHKADNNTALYTHGCYSHLKSNFKRSLGILGGVAGIFAALLLLGMGCSCVLICRRKKDHEYVGLTSPEHLRV